MVIERDRRLSIRVSDDEWQMLQALASRDGLTPSDIVRLNIRRAYADAFGNVPPPIIPSK